MDTLKLFILKWFLKHPYIFTFQNHGPIKCKVLSSKMSLCLLKGGSSKGKRTSYVLRVTIHILCRHYPSSLPIDSWIGDDIKHCCYFLVTKSCPTLL